MRILILTEAGREIGFGHISRCSSLYDELVNRGLNVKFLINSDIKKFNLLEDREYEVVNWNSIKFIKDNITKDDFCIVDSYNAEEDLLYILEKKAYSCLFIDDTGRLDYPRGIVVNPSLDTDSIPYSDKPGVEYLLGKDYVILRNSFQKQLKRVVNSKVSDVLITMGGTDKYDVISVLINNIVKFEKTIHFHVIIGNDYQNKQKLIQNELSNVTVYQELNSNKMKKLMYKCDLAIIAAGQTIYELLATRTPFIPIQTADNQKNNLVGLKKYGIVHTIISIDKPNFINEIIEQFNKLKDYDERKRLTDKNLIDGKGSKRIVDQILLKCFFLRKVEENDLEAVYELSNKDYVRKYSINKDKIKWEEHIKWFYNVLNSKNQYFYVITNKNRDFLGQIRFKKEKTSAVVSISLGEILIGKGLSHHFLQQSINLLIKESNEISKIIAYISLNNIPSKRLFTKCGFIFKDSNNEIERYELNLSKGD